MIQQQAQYYRDKYGLLSLKCLALTCWTSWGTTECPEKCHQHRSTYIYGTWQRWWLWYWTAPALRQSMYGYELSRGLKNPHSSRPERRFIGWAEWSIRGFTWIHLVSRFHGNSRCSCFGRAALTVPRRGTVNPWTERDTRNTRWISWPTYGKLIRCVSVCDSFWCVSILWHCWCMYVLHVLKSLVSCRAVTPRRNVCIFTRLHECVRTCLYTFSAAQFSLHIIRKTESL